MYLECQESSAEIEQNLMKILAPNSIIFSALDNKELFHL